MQFKAGDSKKISVSGKHRITATDTVRVQHSPVGSGPHNLPVYAGIDERVPAFPECCRCRIIIGSRIDVTDSVRPFDEQALDHAFVPQEFPMQILSFVDAMAGQIITDHLVADFDILPGVKQALLELRGFFPAASASCKPD